MALRHLRCRHGPGLIAVKYGRAGSHIGGVVSGSEGLVGRQRSMDDNWADVGCSSCGMGRRIVFDQSPVEFFKRPILPHQFLSQVLCHPTSP